MSKIRRYLVLLNQKGNILAAADSSCSSAVDLIFKVFRFYSRRSKSFVVLSNVYDHDDEYRILDDPTFLHLGLKGGNANVFMYLSDIQAVIKVVSIPKLLCYVPNEAIFPNVFGSVSPDFSSRLCAFGDYKKI